ncbi:GGDEF domain-containing phosphodiesterase [Citromicrobium bathyomarinum]|uniref:GGDEF domain-containing phosphodiesterase n=1 Tax=Citromicrobium bathyomarinum TaxID=72174 RepID=UPI00315A3AEE
MNDVDDRDLLTGLANAGTARRQLGDWLQAGDARVHALLLVLGRFDSVNLAHGADAGDFALAEVARRITHFGQDEFLQGQWFAARIEGGKFLLATREECSRERWQFLAEALADGIAQPLGGISTALPQLWPHVALIRALAGDDPAGILGRLSDAQIALRGEPGRRIVWIDREDTPPGMGATQVEAELRRALDENAVSLKFQPQFAIADDAIIGAEALVRWNQPLLGSVGGEALLRIAARADLTTQLTRRVVGAALKLVLAWPAGLKCSINITAADLAVARFPQELLDMMGDLAVDPARITLEITEQALLGDLDLAARSLGLLRDAGVRIALDDFGAGFCNFGYLKYLPLDIIKLDRIMLDGVAENARDRAVLRGVMAMARALDLEVLAEGVENERQREIAAEEGCTAYQGFLRAKPLTQADFLELVGARD